MPRPNRLSLGDFRLKLNMPDLRLLPDVFYPKPAVQRDFLRALDIAPLTPDGSIQLLPGVNISREALAGVARALAERASNAPVRFLDGITLSTTHLNKGLSLAGVRSPIPSGISVVLDKQRGLVGFLFEGRF